MRLGQNQDNRRGMWKGHCMTAMDSGYGGPAASRFRPIVRRSSVQEQGIAWGLVAFGIVGLVLGAVFARYLNYRAVLICLGASALCFLMGYLTLRPRTVFDRTGIRSRTLLHSYDLAWPGSRDDFDIARETGFALRIHGAGPSVQATVRGETGAVVLGGMTTRALTEPRARYLMEEELDQIWAWAASWGLLPDEDPKSNGPRGGGGHGSSHP